MTTAAEQIKELREFVGLLAAYYDADSARRGFTGKMAARRQAQIIVCAEVHRVLDGRREVLDWLRERDLVELDWRDLEEIAQGLLLPDPAPDPLEENTRLRAALEALVGTEGGLSEPCTFDHAGDCQAHFLGNPCEVATAKALIAK